MSIVNMNMAFIQNAMVQSVQSVIFDPNLNGMGQQLQNTLLPLVANRAAQLLPMLYDTGLQAWDPNGANELIYKLTRAVAAEELSRYNVQLPYLYQQDCNYICNLQSNIQNAINNASRMSGGGGYPNAMNPPGFSNVQGVNKFGNPGMTAFSTAPLPSMGTPLGNPIVQTGFLSNQKQNDNQGNNGMQITDHLPPHMTRTVKEDVYHIKTEPPVQMEPKMVSREIVKKIPVLDKTNTCINDCEVDCGGLGFIGIEEALSSPILINIKKKEFLPAFNPTEELLDQLDEVFKICNVEELFNALERLSKRVSIPGVLAWYDRRISHLVEMLLVHRYGKNKDTVRIPNYREIRLEFEQSFAKYPEMINDINELILSATDQYFYNVELCETSIDDKKSLFIKTIHSQTILTIPWAMEFNYNNGSVHIDKISNEQLFDILDSAWDLINVNMASLIVVDLSNTQYRAYRKGNLKFNPSDYYFECINY